MRRAKNLQGRRGLSLLLEVIFGIGIFSVCMLMVFSLFPTSHRSLTQAKNYGFAGNLARQIMEQERALGYDGLPLGPGPIDLIYGTATVDGTTATTTFNHQRTVAQLTTSAAEGYDSKGLAVRVWWVDGRAGVASFLEREVTLETIVVRY